MIAGEDTLIGLRAREAGYAIYYQPGAKVLHHINATKLSRRYFLRRHYWEGVTQLVLEDCRKNLDNRKLRGILLWHLGNILKEGLCMCNCGFVWKANRSSKLMLHLGMIGISIGICVKSLQLLLNK
jgi:GT2 family glycosyltransferase